MSHAKHSCSLCACADWSRQGPPRAYSHALILPIGGSDSAALAATQRTAIPPAVEDHYIIRCPKGRQKVPLPGYHACVPHLDRAALTAGLPLPRGCVSITSALHWLRWCIACEMQGCEVCNVETPCLTVDIKACM